MSENHKNPQDNDANKGKKKTFGYKPKKRHTLGDAEKALNAAAKSSVQDDTQKQAAEQNNHQPPQNDRDAQIKEYKALGTDLDQALVKLAELKNANQDHKVMYQEIASKSEIEIARLTAEAEQQKIDKTRDFMAALEKTHTSLGTAITEIQNLDADKTILDSFVEGLELTSKNLSDLFNSHAGGTAPAAPKPADFVPPAKIEVEQVEKLDLEGKDKDISTDKLAAETKALTAKLKDVYTTIDSYENANQIMEEKLGSVVEDTGAQLTRARRDLERQAEMALKDIAKDAIPVADQLSLAVRALESQKDTLGNSFNTIATKIEKIEAELQDSFSKFGIEKVKSQGEKPDFDIHQVIGYDEDNKDTPSGHIAKVEQEGYKLNNKPLRDAMVRIAP
ncbi:MAG: nucleotide exchange factor GrpE [Pseudomonadota bacterium]